MKKDPYVCALCNTYRWVETMSVTVNSWNGIGPLTCNMILRMRPPSLSTRALHPYDECPRHPHGARR